MQSISNRRLSKTSNLCQSASVSLRRTCLTGLRTLLFAAVLWFAGPSVTNAQNTWLGTSGTTGNWSDATKWSLNAVPDGSTAILIPTGR